MKHTHTYIIDIASRQVDGDVQTFTAACSCGKKKIIKRRRIITGRMKRTPLSPVSDAMRKRLSKYNRTAPVNDPAHCPMCKASLSEATLSRHHPFGRSGDHLFTFLAMCQHCHDWIHENSNQAYDLGWLQPEYRGQPHNNTHPIPWNQ